MDNLKEANLDIELIESEDKDVNQVRKELKKAFMYNGNREGETNLLIQSQITDQLSENEFESTIFFQTNEEDIEKVEEEVEKRLENLNLKFYNGKDVYFID